MQSTQSMIVRKIFINGKTLLIGVKTMKNFWFNRNFIFLKITKMPNSKKKILKDSNKFMLLNKNILKIILKM